MSQPRAFQKMRDRKAAELAAATESSNRIHKQQQDEEAVLYKKIAAALKPYTHCTLTDNYGTKRRVNVMDNSHERKVTVFFDGYRFLTFRPERHFGSCHCENACNCESTTWLTLDVTQHRKQKGYENYGCWFSCGESSLEDEDAFASSMNDMLTEFRHSGWVKE